MGGSLNVGLRNCPWSMPKNLVGPCALWRAPKHRSHTSTPFPQPAFPQMFPPHVQAAIHSPWIAAQSRRKTLRTSFLQWHISFRDRFGALQPMFESRLVLDERKKIDFRRASRSRVFERVIDVANQLDHLDEDQRRERAEHEFNNKTLEIRDHDQKNDDRCNNFDERVSRRDEPRSRNDVDARHRSM